MVEPPVVHVVPHVGAAVVRAAVRQRWEQLRRAVVRRILKRINQSNDPALGNGLGKMNWPLSPRTKKLPRPSSDFLLQYITCTRALMTELTDLKLDSFRP